MARTNPLAVRVSIALLLSLMLIPAVGAVLALPGGALFGTEMAVLLGVGFAGILLAAWSIRL